MYKLLIVDDEPIVRNGIRKLMDYDALKIDEVFEAENGQKALDIVKNNAIDIVLADINMPKMNGLDFAKNAKAFNGDIKIAMVTGYDYFDYAVSALRNGVDEYILKPVSKKDIEKILNQMIKTIEESKVSKELSNIQNDEISSHEKSYDYKYQINKIIEEKLSDSSFSLVALSSEINLSSSYLSRLFKEYYGIAFRDYILQERIKKAKILLLSSEKKIYEICEEIGFDDPNYFSASFKKATGYSPNTYRKHVRDD